MKSLTAVAMLGLALTFCNLSQRLANRNNNHAPVKTVQPAAPAFGKHYDGNVDDLFPKKVLDYSLVFTIDPRKFGLSVPEGTEVRGGVYRSHKNEIVKHMLVNFGSIAEAARNLQIFLRDARKQNAGLAPEPVRDNSGNQIGERFAFSDAENNLFWTNGSLFVVVKSKSKDTVDKFAQALPYYVELQPAK
ncbi:MAG TPA: hypothetical protein VHR36_16590 [Pyrinomonadaceae bacterium]|jgi:hypothetical protein|nr:hypothetical protein [Pyrinomonadaceae bacterium]